MKSILLLAAAAAIAAAQTCTTTDGKPGQWQTIQADSRYVVRCIPTQQIITAVRVTMLPAGSQATASFQDGALTISIPATPGPAGPAGATGPAGSPGPQGPAGPVEIKGQACSTMVEGQAYLRLTDGTCAPITIAGGGIAAAAVTPSAVAAATSCEAQSDNGKDYTCTLPGMDVYPARLTVTVVPARANSGPVSLRVNGLKSYPVMRQTANGLEAGEWAPDTPRRLTLIGAAWRQDATELQPDTPLTARYGCSSAESFNCGWPPRLQLMK